MKKLFAVIALAGIMISCNNSKEEKTETKTDTTGTTTTTPEATDPTTTVTTTTTPAAGVPTFSDPEVQKFANDYAAFVNEYKAGMTDPNKMQEMAKNLQDWTTRSQSIGMKLSQNPDEAKKWADWVAEVNKQLMPAGK